MGIVRGEMELWITDYFWHVAQYALARTGRVVNTAFLGPYGLLPDLLSGFKMFTRPAAAAVAQGIARAVREHPDLHMARYGSELVPAAEVLLAGGLVGQMIRGTLEGQPCSGFARFDPLRMYPDQLIWTARRMDIDGAAACRFFDNACVRSPLSADAAIAEQFAAMRRILADRLGHNPDPQARSGFC